MSNNLLIFILITILFLDLYDQMTYDKNINIKPVMSSTNKNKNTQFILHSLKSKKSIHILKNKKSSDNFFEKIEKG
jgi:hypothetical protein